ncbi:MAG: thiolase family protein [Candidatus Omnitrophica bacterium]|nr:thiolase family protein [Candidatus Omnitrophota bacterium]
MPKLFKNIYIIDGMRTPIGSPFKSLKCYDTPYLAAAVIPNLLKKHKVKGSLIDEVILGNTVSAGIGQNFARKALDVAGLPVTIPAHTVNSVCGSGLQSIIDASQAIMAGHADLILAGGAESATHTPYLIPKDSDVEQHEKALIDSLLYDGLTCSLSEKLMGDLCEELAQKHNITRDQQDRFALLSHQKAVAAQQEGKFSEEIVPVLDEHGKEVNKDDRPRKRASLEALSSLNPAFKEAGTITSGNSCSPCDGASVLLMGSAEVVERNYYQPKAKLLGFSSVGLKAEDTFSGAVQAVNSCLKDCELKLEDIDIFEVCESFAAQAIFTKEQLNIPGEKMNLWGGDIALGHPLGVAGARVLVTLLHILKDQNKKKGMVCICFGSGGAMAMAVEAL